MSQRRLTRTMAAAAVGILSTLLTGTAAAAARVDSVPPTAPIVGYAQGFYCLTVIIGAQRSTDNVTPRPELRYEAFANGVPIGSLADHGHPGGAWGVLQLKRTGSNTVTVQAIDAAGNRSAISNTQTVTGYYTPGCTPWKIG